jgi:hypothetical protein
MKRVPSVGRLDCKAAVRPAYPGARLVRRARDKAVAWSSYVKRSSLVATASSPVKLGSTVVRSLSRHSLKVGLLSTASAVATWTAYTHNIHQLPIRHPTATSYCLVWAIYAMGLRKDTGSCCASLLCRLGSRHLIEWLQHQPLSSS